MSAKQNQDETAKSDRTAAAPAKTHSFQAEVAKLLQLMIHSVYSDREVFLRELVANATDACDRLRYAAIADPTLTEGDTDMKITVSADSDAAKLTISDNGIGMSRDDMVNNLGTIARSGAQAFLRGLEGGKSGHAGQIGRFGIGFYAAFMVGERVEVVSRKAGADEVWLWRSEGTGTFDISPYPAGAEGAPARGTTIVLHLRENAREFLEAARLSNIIRTYCDHIAVAIMLEAEGETRQVNEAGALWTRPKKDITPEQYREFLGHLSGVHGDPALTIHYHAEGRLDYDVLLFAPGEKPFDLYEPDRKGRQKLYVRRVFITDDAKLLPPYLRFLCGIIDSQDMPLNVSREMLQRNPLVEQIRKAVTKRVLAGLKDLSENDAGAYAKLWSNFGPVIKEGLYEDFERRDELFELVRFHTTISPNETRTLKDYVAAMKPKQEAIYYITGENAAKVASSPQIEGFKARGIEVLLLADPIDAFWTASATGYDGKPFRSVTQGEADLDAFTLENEGDGAAQGNEDKTAIGTLAAAMKQALGDAVSDVRASKRLTDSPVCLVAATDGLDRNLERLLLRQKAAGVTRKAPIMEINPHHRRIAVLAGQAKHKGTTDQIADAARLLLDQAFILEGESVPDPSAFARRMAGVMAQALGSSVLGKPMPEAPSPDEASSDQTPAG
ncbi:MAG: molecular chaperone HtpG [Hyphomicrobiales bacterium]